MMFLLRRLGAFLLTMWIVYTISFLLVRSIPGGPFAEERNVPEATRRNIEDRYELNKPLAYQYVKELKNYCRLDFGHSFKIVDFTVNDIIRQGLPVSASLGICALVLAVALGVAAGVISSVYRGTILDFCCMSLATLGIAIPNFVLSSLCILVFVFKFEFFPVAGWGSFSQMILPTFCLAAPYAAYIARLTRAGMMEVLNRDYIRTAYAKGLESRTVIIKHALRGAVLPVVTYLGPAAAGILTGSLVVERIFNIPGIGPHFIEAALQVDSPLLMAIVMLYTLLLFLMNAAVDLSYALIDPRIKME